MHEVNHRAGAKQRLQSWVSVAAALALLLAACGSDDDDDSGTTTGTTAAAGQSGGDDALGPPKAAQGTPVAVGFITDGKNQSTDQSVELDVAAAATKYLNEHKGGIGGRPIELTTCEAKLDPATGTDCANRMVEKKVVAVVVGTTGVTEAVWQPLRDAKVPTFFYAGSGTKLLADNQSTFSLGSPTASTIDTPAGVAKDNNKKKVTAIVIDVPAALNSYQGPGAAGWKERGIELDLVRVPPGTADMTPQLQKLASGDPGVVHVLGNDSFCISAFQALEQLNVDAPITTISPCLSDATRKAIRGEFLEGMTMTAVAPIGDDGESTALIRAVAGKYSPGLDLSRTAVFGTFIAMTGFAAAVEGITGQITPATVTAAIKAMPEKELPASGGLKFRCNGKAAPAQPAVCVRGALVTTLDDKGNAGEYRVVGNTSIAD